MTTGVSNFIKLDEVRQEIDSTYHNPGDDVETELKIENNGYGHLLIGNAFEFLCQLLLYRQSTEIIESVRRTFGDQMPRFIGDDYPPIFVERYDGMRWEEHPEVSSQSEWDELMEERPVWERRRSAVQWTEDEELSQLAEQYVQTGMNTKGVVKAALINAGWKPNEEVHSWIDRDAFEADVLAEMEALFGLLREQEWTEGEMVFEKPTFGGHRHILPGEGDFIVDDLLVDIKTTENPSFTNSFWQQVLLYYVLTDVQRILQDVEGRTYGKEAFEGKYPDIERVGIYFARYGELKTVDMRDLIDDQDEYEEFRAWLVDRAIEENRHAQHDYTAIRAALTEPYDYKRQQTLSDF